MTTPTLTDLLSSERTQAPGWVYVLFTGVNGMVQAGTMIWARGLGSALVIADEHGLNPGMPAYHIRMPADYNPPLALRYQLFTMDTARTIDIGLVPKGQR